MFVFTLILFCDMIYYNQRKGLPMIQYEYFNARLLQNTALKIQDTVGELTPPQGYAFGVLSALTNLETVSSTLVQDYNAVFIHTLGVTVPTEEAVDAFVHSAVAGSTDDITVSTNEDNELQAIGLINKNTANGATNPIYDWVGTLEEYTTQDIANQHPDWVCFITDDAYDPQSTYTFDQGVAADTWEIQHNLNKYPSVTVVDSAGTTIDCTVTYINSNELELKFNAAFKGSAFLN